MEQMYIRGLPSLVYVDDRLPENHVYLWGFSEEEGVRMVEDLPEGMIVMWLGDTDETHIERGEN